MSDTKLGLIYKDHNHQQELKCRLGWSFLADHEDNTNNILPNRDITEEPLRLVSKSLKNVLLNNKFSIEDASLLT